MSDPLMRGGERDPLAGWKVKAEAEDNPLFDPPKPAQLPPVLKVLALVGGEEVELETKPTIYAVYRAGARDVDMSAVNIKEMLPALQQADGLRSREIIGVFARLDRKAERMTPRQLENYRPTSARMTTCRACHDPILWTHIPTGKAPVDIKPAVLMVLKQDGLFAREGNEKLAGVGVNIFEFLSYVAAAPPINGRPLVGVYITHFATCNRVDLVKARKPK
jgi:hypothetical protein